MSSGGEGAGLDMSCRIDVWLWRARFFKTRALACRFVEDGRIRLTRAGSQTRLYKASRSVKPGDGLVFAINGRLATIRIEAMGERRGPATEARSLYSELPNEQSKEATAREATGRNSA